MGLNILNPDAYVAKYNITRFKATGKIDASYIGRLSFDALPVSEELLDLLDGKSKKESICQIPHFPRTCLLTKQIPWHARNLSATGAVNFFKNKLKARDCFRPECRS